MIQETSDGNSAAIASAAERPHFTQALLISYFVLCGLDFGSQGVLWAEMVQALGLSKGEFGSAQLVLPLLGIVVFLFGGPLTASVGKKRLSLVGLALSALSALMLANAGGLWSFVGGLALLGLGFAAVEMAMNSATLDWEAASRRAVMNQMHALFSGGAMIGAVVTGALLQAGVSYSRILWVFAGLYVPVFLATLFVRFPLAASVQEMQRAPSAALHLLIKHRGLLALAVLGMFGVVGESVANIWSVIHLHSLGAAAMVSGGAYAIFNGAMFIGRLANAPLLTRYGARTSLLVSGGLLLLSGTLLMVPDNLPVAILAFAMTGLGVAGILPTTLTAAASYASGSSGAVTGAIMGTLYLSFAICAPLVGWLAELRSLRFALLTVAASGLGILWLASGVCREKYPQKPDPCVLEKTPEGDSNLR